MSGSNALQITDPAASDNPLAQAPSWADAYRGSAVANTVAAGVDRLGQWLAEQRAKSAKMGLWNDVTGLPTGRGLVSAAQQTGNALLMGTTAPGVRAYHASPYDFGRFSTDYIGTGEGAQAYARGLYFAGHEPVMEGYYNQFSQPRPPQALRDAQAEYNAKYSAVDASMPQDQFDAAIKARDEAYQRLQEAKKLPPEPTPAHRYEVNIGADPQQMLDWDKPFSEQSKSVQEKLLAIPELKSALESQYAKFGYDYVPGGALHTLLADASAKGDFGAGQAAAAQRLSEAGIPGVRYLDQGSRGAGEGTHNYVVFDANTIAILRKYGIAGLMLGATGAAGYGSQQQPPMAQ